LAKVLIKGTDTIGEFRGFIFQCLNIFPGVGADRLKAQIQAVAPIIWHFVADASDKPWNYHMLEFASGIGTVCETMATQPRRKICGAALQYPRPTMRKASQT
jgi:hypothetical protein